MTTIHDLTDDDVRLFDLFMILDDRGQGEALKQVAVTGCHAVAERTASADGSAFDLSPKAATLDALHRCRPRLPSGWASDSDFEFEVENAVVLKLGDAAIDIVLTASAHDQRNAERLAQWAHDHATRIGSDFCAPSFDEGYLSADVMRAFIEDWRDSFMTSLWRASERAARRS